MIFLHFRLKLSERDSRVNRPLVFLRSVWMFFEAMAVLICYRLFLKNLKLRFDVGRESVG
ncbi:MAG: hypothetical protein DWI22_09220 [Planctomycetota bacterium]|nr:MAG: hypothetical protein DWI22_09220 [Planctomycetota bacterium]